MVKYFLIALASLFMISNNYKIKKYNVEEIFFTKLIELKDKTACVCFDLDNLNKNSTFYLKETCDDINSKIDTTLYYNYIESCDSKTICDDIYLNNYEENNNRIEDIESIAGFSYQYKFTYEDENKKAILVRYKNFNGKQFIMQFTFFTLRISYIITIGILSGMLIIYDLIKNIIGYLKFNKRNIF